ncbi:VOC family protein [Rhodosalinus sediminis]|uniref:VOC family protein n=1 Tax=Rhodosalinus sediminis TaxID=1940533 RepID=UPI00235381E9|nr:VOC family protein [Rhodosalinus sediminis]
MLTDLDGLHHVTSVAGPPRPVDRFWREVMGLRRIKTTVNFDAPEVYHLYFGDRVGTPGTVMTHFPFPAAPRGTPGTGEAGHVAFSIPPGAAADWERHLAAHDVPFTRESLFGETRLALTGPDGERLVLVEAEDARAPWTALPEGMAIRGLHSVSLRVADRAAMLPLLALMGYAETGQEGAVTRLADATGGPGHLVEIEHRPDLPAARQGAGSIHHVAFRTRDAESQARIRAGLTEAGHRVTEVRDRDYFRAIYFATPGGILFEVATDDPGFARDEPVETLGERLCLPEQHAHLRAHLEEALTPLDRPA